MQKSQGTIDDENAGREMQKWRYKQLKGVCTQKLPTGADSKHKSVQGHQRQKPWEQGEQATKISCMGGNNDTKDKETGIQKKNYIA